METYDDHLKNTSNTISWSDFWIISGLLFVLYMPVYVSDFGFLDDYNILYSFIQRDKLQEVGTSVGRQLGMWITYGFFHIGILMDAGIGALKYARFIAVCGFVLLALLFHRSLLQSGWDRLSAIAVILVLFSTPPFQISSTYAVLSCRLGSYLAAAAAYLLAMRGLDHANPRKRWVALVLSVAVLLVSLNVYQPDTLIFLVFIAIELLGQFQRPLENVKRTAQYLVILFASLALGFIQMKGLAILSQVQLHQRTSLATDYWGKGKWFLTTALPGSLNPFTLSHDYGTTAILTASVIVLGLFLHFRGGWLSRLGTVCLLLLFIPLSYLPNLLVAENWESYHTRLVIATMTLVLFLFGLRAIIKRICGPVDQTNRLSNRVLPAVCFLLAAAACVACSFNVINYMIKPWSIELSVLSSQLDSREQLLATRLIHFYRPTWSQNASPVIAMAEFGFPSTEAWWVPEPVTRLLLNKKFDIQPEEIQIKVFDQNEPVGAGGDATIVNMRVLPRYRLDGQKR